MDRSIYEYILDQLAEGLLPEGFSLPDDESSTLNAAAGDDGGGAGMPPVHFADGAMDGIAIYHMGLPELDEAGRRQMERAVKIASADIVQEADAIFQEELVRFGIDTGKGQFFAALSDMRSVGVMGDHRTYDCAIVLRAVLTSDFMTATAARLPYELLQTCMNRIVNEISGVNRVLYDITSKPPATIELE
jgi:hypothetical protein